MRRREADEAPGDTGGARVRAGAGQVPPGQVAPLPQPSGALEARRWPWTTLPRREQAWRWNDIPPSMNRATHGDEEPCGSYGEPRITCDVLEKDLRGLLQDRAALIIRPTSYPGGGSKVVRRGLARASQAGQ